MADNRYPNTTIDLLCNRTSCRDFLDKPIAPEMMQSILESGIHAANGGNLQPYSIIKIEKRETRARLADLCGRQSFIADAPTSLMFCIDWHRIERWAKLEGAPFTAADSFKMFWISIQDVVLCAQQMATAADSLGLGSVYVGFVLEPMLELCKLMQLPQGVMPVVMLCLGHPAQKPASAPRLDTEIVVHNETYRDPPDEQLLAAFRNKFSHRRQAVTEKTLRQVDEVCRNTEGKAFAQNCLDQIRQTGYTNAAQTYFNLIYRADTMPQGNKKFVERFEELGFGWFKEWALEAHPEA